MAQRLLPILPAGSTLITDTLNVRQPAVIKRSASASIAQRPTASARTRSNAAESPESPNGLIPPHEPL